MRFPPPARYFAPILVLVFGLAIIWFDYELNLFNDLHRHLSDVKEHANATGTRLAKLSAQLLPQGGTQLLESDLIASVDAPSLELAAVVDADGRVLAASDRALAGRNAAETSLAQAWRLARRGSGESVLNSEDKARLNGAYPIAHEGAWALVVYDRAEAIASARADARGQLRWIGSAIGLLCLTLWAALHFGFAERIARLTRGVRGFGAGESAVIQPIRGGDEVAELSGAFAAMAARVKAHEAERATLEREVLEASESERRRIGHELHDGLGQRLTAASLATNALASALQTSASADAPRAEDIARQIREAIGETRALSHGLAPVGVEAGGLMNALATLAEMAKRSGNVRAIFECPEPVAVPDTEQATHLFRIAQEAVNNALKHAAPGEIRIGLAQREKSLVLEIEDDGDGLPERLPAGGGIGLRVMRHRAGLLGGSLEIIPSTAGGTLIRCRCSLVSAAD